MKAGSADGFSLVEMLVSLAVIALVFSALAVNPFATKREASIDVVASSIAAFLRKHAAESVTKGQPAEIRIDIGGRTISSAETVMHVAQTIGMRFRTGVELVEKADKGSIIFLADGSSSGGEISLMSSDGKVLTIRINWATGGVNIQRASL